MTRKTLLLFTSLLTVVLLVWVNVSPPTAGEPISEGLSSYVKIDHNLINLEVLAKIER